MQCLLSVNVVGEGQLPCLWAGNDLESSCPMRLAARRGSGPPLSPLWLV